MFAYSPAHSLSGLTTSHGHNQTTTTASIPPSPFQSLVLASAFLYPQFRHLDTWVRSAAFHTLLDLACLLFSVFKSLFFSVGLCRFFIMSPVHDTPHYPTLLVFLLCKQAFLLASAKLFFLVIIVGREHRKRVHMLGFFFVLFCSWMEHGFLG